jgi:pyridoxal 5'-phosphate synthase pdxT subunit
MAGPFGVLALQGGFAAHVAAFRELGIEAREVRRVRELDGLAGLMIPGGESSTLLNLMRDEPWLEAVRGFRAAGGVVAGTCAGAILLSREVRPRQPSLGLLDAVIERNAWGRQVDSFEARVDAPALGGVLDAVFIRAPRFRALFPDVEVLARHAGEPVLVRQGKVVAATFHPELTSSRLLHRYLAGLADPGALDAAAAGAGTARAPEPRPGGSESISRPPGWPPRRPPGSPPASRRATGSRARIRPGR